LRLTGWMLRDNNNRNRPEVAGNHAESMAYVAREKLRAQKDIWLVYTTKKSGQALLAYGNGVKEALCLGWIDAPVKSIDSAGAY
jgi:uncharacterized protein YdeI (YjbR/CyaY-like superfamily)